jgi:hypothetical protein
MTVAFLTVLVFATVATSSEAFTTLKTAISTEGFVGSHHPVGPDVCFQTAGILKTEKAPSSTNTQLWAVSESQSISDDAIFIAPDFRLSSIFLFSAVVFAQVPVVKFILAPLTGLLGILFLVQTFRLKFVCDSEAFELLNTSQESGENILVGGQNRWTYDSFVNYEFFPKGWIDQPQGPILVYFKETQTPDEKWKTGPGATANSDQAQKNGAVPGQAHFFPALCNCKQLRAEWEKKGCAKL